MTSMLLLISCNKESLNPSVKMIGHGISGFGLFNQMFPSNSESGLKYALSFSDLDAIEVDIQLTKDSLFVCYHNEFLEDKTTGTGAVFETILKDVMKVNYLSFNNEKIMTFEEFSSHDLSSVEVFLDVKTYQVIPPEDRELYIALIEDAILKLNCKKVGVFLEDESILSALDGTLADRYVHVVDFESGKVEVANHQYEGVISRNSTLNKEEWRYFKENGLKSVIFDVKANSSYQTALNKQTDYIEIDDIANGLEYK